MVHKMYKQYARPLARIVRGSQASWDPVIAAVYVEDFTDKAAWSPCNRFIAVAKSRAVEIRDATTLTLLSNFESPPDPLAFSFSPDGRFLTQFHRLNVVTWDLQTGVSVITPSPGFVGMNHWVPPAYSMDGTMLVAEGYMEYSKKPFITIHNLSTTPTHPYYVPSGYLVSPIWIHGEFLRFATVKSGYITIWQAEFTFTHPPEVVESLPTPDELIDGGTSAQYLFLPTISRLVITLENTLLVWDARDSKRLLKVSDSQPFGMSSSSDGCFLVCGLKHGVDTGIHIWKKSPGDYILHQKLAFTGSGWCPRPLLSPNGESIILTHNSIIHLLHTTDPFLSGHPTLAMDQPAFVLNFSPNEALAAFTREYENVVTILDLRSGNPQLEIDTGMKVECLAVTGSTVAAAGKEKVGTWKLDMRDTRANIHNDVRITMLDIPSRYLATMFYSTSSDLSRVITLAVCLDDEFLAIYDVSTGRCHAGYTSSGGALKPLSTLRARFKATDMDEHVGAKTAWLTPDGCEIWGASDSDSPACRWEVIEDGESDTIELQPLTAAACPPGVIPWQSSRGYEVTHDGWILSPTQKRLLWLPHRWRSVERDRRWGGRFLGLFHPGLPDVVILEFPD